MDFMNRLRDKVNQIPNLPIKCKLGYLDADEDFKLYPIAGSRVITEFYDSVKDQQLNYEFACKSKNLGKINDTLWLVQNVLEELSELTSLDSSFDFDSMVITNKPFINQLEATGFYVFLVDVQANITTY